MVPEHSSPVPSDGSDEGEGCEDGEEDVDTLEEVLSDVEKGANEVPHEDRDHVDPNENSEKCNCSSCLVLQKYGKHNCTQLLCEFICLCMWYCSSTDRITSLHFKVVYPVGESYKTPMIFFLR